MFNKDRRLEPREKVALPLRVFEQSPAVTRDISPLGMFVHVPGVHHFSGTVVFEMQLPLVGMTCTAEGEIVRLEYGEDCTGVAVRLVSAKLACAS